MWQLLERKISFPNCLFVCFVIRISRFFSSYFFCYPHFFYHPHFPIRIRHPQVSGPRFTDTRFATHCANPHSALLPVLLGQSYSASDIEWRFTSQPLSALPWLISLRDRSSNFPVRAPATEAMMPLRTRLWQTVHPLSVIRRFSNRTET